jgi:hypothetical protein
VAQPKSQGEDKMIAAAFASFASLAIAWLVVPARKPAE